MRLALPFLLFVIAFFAFGYLGTSEDTIQQIRNLNPNPELGVNLAWQQSGSLFAADPQIYRYVIMCFAPLGGAWLDYKEDISPGNARCVVGNIFSKNYMWYAWIEVIILGLIILYSYTATNKLWQKILIGMLFAFPATVCYVLAKYILVAGSDVVVSLDPFPYIGTMLVGPLLISLAIPAVASKTLGAEVCKVYYNHKTGVPYKSSRSYRGPDRLENTAGCGGCGGLLLENAFFCQRCGTNQRFYSENIEEGAYS